MRLEGDRFFARLKPIAYFRMFVCPRMSTMAKPFKYVLLLSAPLFLWITARGQNQPPTDAATMSALPYVLMGLGVLALVLLAIRQRGKSARVQKRLLMDQVQEATAEIRQQKQMIERQKAELEAEKDKSEKLLQNLLPQETVDELKVKGKARARHYRSVTIMFTDFVGFTKVAEQLKPADLVAMLDSYFVEFDEIIARHNIEKIKTMGDAYMAAGGIPIRNRSNPIDTVLAGLQIQHKAKEITAEMLAQGKPLCELRLGMHTGELVAGVIGIKRFAYDIWGDSVNIAKRMESSGAAGKVNVSGKTYQKIKEFFDCTHRGQIEAKNKGEVNMYFVDRIKPEFSADEAGIFPNDRFWEYVNLELYSSINYTKAERHIMRLLKAELSGNLLYHGLEHTRDVCAQVERIARSENIVGEDLFLLKTAALYHDAGFVKQYKDNEPVGAAMAREALPNFGYTATQIDLVERLILATKVPQQPKTALERIMCDADLDYLGREDFWEISDRLKDELLAHKMIESHRQWDELQISFLEKHSYFTGTNQRERETLKRQHLKDVRARLAEDNYPETA